MSRKKLLALVLALSTIVSLCPVQAVAVERSQGSHIATIVQGGFHNERIVEANSIRGESSIQTHDTTEILDSGSCGTDVKWSLDKDYILTISGTGDMTDWSYTGQIPWYSQWKDRIRAVIVEQGVTSIGSGAFVGCSAIIGASLPDSVTRIGSYAFSNCSSFSSITLPSKLVSIGDYAFGWCNGLTSITIPKGVKVIGIAPFAACASMTSISVEVGNKAYKVQNGVLLSVADNKLVQFPSGKSGSVIVPNGVTSIGVYAFGSAEKITSITLPSSLQMVYDSAFVCCHVLQKLIFPKALSYVGNEVFGHSYCLKSVYFSGNAPTFHSNAFGGDSKNETALTATVYYPKNNVTWASAIQQNYGGSISWIAWSSAATYKNEIATTQTTFKKTYSTKEQSFTISASCLSKSKLSYQSNNKSVKVTSAGKVTIAKKFLGSATITITAPKKGEYTQTTKKITVSVKPKGTDFTKISSPYSSWFKAKWKKISGVTGYQIKMSEVNKYYEPDGKEKTMTVKGASKTSLTLSGLTKGRIYHTVIRTYIEQNGKKYYSDWSSSGTYLKLDW